MKKILYLALGLSASLVISSCGGGDDDPILNPVNPNGGTTGGGNNDGGNGGNDGGNTGGENNGGGGTNTNPEDYTAPTYDDYYVDVTDWTKRSKWNLANVHDPSVMLADDGYYYMYQTDASYGNAHMGKGHFLCRRSKDLVNWEFLGATMKAAPAWMKDKVNEIRANMGLGATSINFNGDDIGYWAPTVRKVSSNLYRMYYSINLPTMGANGDNMTDATFNPNLIGMMETSDPSDVNSWQDKGYVICQYSDQNKSYKGKSIWGGYWKYNAIDPSYIITPEGQHWLIYGSWHSGFAAVELDPVTGYTKTELGDPWGSANEAAYGKRVFTRVNGDRWQGSEGPEVVYHNGYYYMFIAYGQLAHAYHTRVVRSENIDGPYKDYTGLDFTNGQKGGTAYPAVTHPYKFGKDHGWEGISHCAVWDDGKGNFYYSSQQRFPDNYKNNAYSNALMMGAVRAIIWTEDGWPLVLPERYGAVPQSAITAADLAGNWQHINLGGCSAIWDNDCKKDASVDIALSSDGTVSADSKWSAGKSWSFDASKNILTIGDVKLYLKRELDWEASPRVPTIVYVGLSADGKTTFWGKKVE